MNTPWAKNFVGAFHHPVGVYCDPQALATLSDRDLRCGIAESIKVALCGAPGLFELLEDDLHAVERRDPAVLEELVRRSAAHKVALLAPDPYEVDLRRALNLGHTYGHALEVELSFDGILHGEAVAVGLVVATLLSRARGLIPAVDADRILGLVDRYDIIGDLEPSHLRAATKLVDDVRLGRRDEPESQDVRLGLGVLWGEQLRAQVGWRWVHLTYPDGFASYALVPDDRAFACFPLNRLPEALHQGGTNTSAHVFESIRTGTLPARKANAYLVIG